MRKFGIAAMLGLALVATACAKKDNADEGVPADTATMAPAPAPAPAPMDTGAAMDTTAVDTTKTTM
ncbi:MAG TPA: hypothetical protein VF021_06945 [Longimicrobiales bacterium]